MTKETTSGVEKFLKVVEEMATELAAQRGDCSYGETGGVHCPPGRWCLACQVRALTERLVHPSDHEYDLDAAALRAEWDKARADIARLFRPEPCGHPHATVAQSLETAEKFCMICRMNEMLNDALIAEAQARAERDAATSTLATAVAQAVAEEREACALVAERAARATVEIDGERVSSLRFGIASAIRAGIR